MTDYFYLLLRCNWRWFASLLMESHLPQSCCIVLSMKTPETDVIFQAQKNRSILYIYLHVVGNGEPGDLVLDHDLELGLEGLLVNRGVLLEDNVRVHALALDLVREPDHGRLSHGSMLVLREYATQKFKTVTFENL